MAQKTETEEIAIEVAKLFPVQGKWTEEDYFNLPDTNHLAELSEGRLVFLDMPTDEHQKAVGELFLIMGLFVREHNLGEIRVAPMPVKLKEGQIREPDIVFMRNTHRNRISRKTWGVPDLAVEVISRSTEKVDRELKFAEYAEAGITEYWLVDTAEKTIEVFVLDQGSYKLLSKWGTGEAVQSKVLAGFQVAVDSLMTN